MSLKLLEYGIGIENCDFSKQQQILFWNKGNEETKKNEQNLPYDTVQWVSCDFATRSQIPYKRI
jgi:hypothetical protein